MWTLLLGASLVLARADVVNDVRDILDATTPPPLMTEADFLAKWPTVERLAASASQTDPPVPGANPFQMLINAIQQITGAWQSIVNAFKSSYTEQLLESHIQNGWKEFKEGTKVFKGAGLAYGHMQEFFSDIRNMISIPATYSKDFDDQIQWIKFFDNTTWSQHNTQFSQGKGGSDTIFTMYARNRQDDQKVDVLFLTCDQNFKLADDYFVISESKSILGGIFSSTKIRFKKRPAALTDKDLMFVSDYFSLLAYQQVALAEGTAAPPDPNFPPGMLNVLI